MPYNAQWTAFCNLLDIDGTRTDYMGEKARDLKAVLSKYMELRFGTTDITPLVDIINDAALVDAVIVSINHTANDTQAILDAAAAVVAGGA